MSLTNEAKQEVEKLLLAGQKIAAIKYMADTFGVDPGQAKALVEAVETEMKNENRFSRASNSNTPSISGNLRADVTTLLREYKKIEAIKRVHDELRVGLKTAKDIVDEIDHSINPNRPALSSRAGCAGGAFSTIFGIIGIGLIGICVIIYYLQERTISNSEVVTGTVINLRSSSDGDTYAPDIEYTFNGQTHTYQSSSYTNPSAFDVDEQVQLFVNKDDPSDVVVNSITERWLAIIIVGGIGSVFTFFSAIFFFARRKF